MIGYTFGDDSAHDKCHEDVWFSAGCPFDNIVITFIMSTVGVILRFDTMMY